jgi:hypothetical protein
MLVCTDSWQIGIVYYAPSASSHRTTKPVKKNHMVLGRELSWHYRGFSLRLRVGPVIIFVRYDSPTCDLTIRFQTSRIYQNMNHVIEYGGGENSI